MIRRLLCACVGAVFLCVLTVPDRAGAKPPDLPEDGSFTLDHGYSSPAHLFRFQWPTDATDSKYDPLQSAEDDVLKDVPRHCYAEGGVDYSWYIWRRTGFDEWKWLISHWTARQQPPPSAENDGYIHPPATGMDFAFQVATDTPPSDSPKPDRSAEVLPMPKEEPESACPYLRQQRIDRHACQLADPEIGRGVLDNLKLLQEADDLLELAKNLADDGYLDAAIECCDEAAELCPGSPCAARAAAVRRELALGSMPPTRDSEEAAEPQPDRSTGSDDVNDRILEMLDQSEDLKQIEEAYESVWVDTPAVLAKIHQNAATNSEPGIELMVSGLMKACHLLMNQGMQHQATELARQAYALDPQRVMADPLIYKMHLLAESPTAQPAGASEESEPQTCPYCPSPGKPIRAIVPQKKKRHPKDTSQRKPTLIENTPFEIAANAEGELRVNAECALGGNVYHLRYTHGSLAIWTTADDSQTKP